MKKNWKLLVIQGIVWLVIWSSLFMAFRGIHAVFTYGLPRIRIEWPDREKNDQEETSVGKWIKQNRPALPADFLAVGTELIKTADLMANGVLIGLGDSEADTIARIQPIVSDANAWRCFINDLTSKFIGTDAITLSGEYRQSGDYFIGTNNNMKTEWSRSDEETDRKIDAQIVDGNHLMDYQRPDESKYQENASGESQAYSQQNLGVDDRREKGGRDTAGGESRKNQLESDSRSISSDSGEYSGTVQQLTSRSNNWLYRSKGKTR